MASYIINGKRYALTENNLICEVEISNQKLIVDPKSKKKKLYYPKEKEFVMTTCDELREYEIQIVSKKVAMGFLNKYPEGIIEKNYIKFFGEPEEA